MQALRWRMRMQGPFFFAYIDLLDKGLLRQSALEKGVPFDRADSECESLVQLLQSFTMMQEACYIGGNDHRGFFSAPVYWFANIILRACATNVAAIIEYCMNTKILGEFDPKWLSEIEGDLKKEFTLLDFGATIAPQDFSRLPAVGFWLPRSFGPDSTAKFKADFMMRYRRALQAYEDCFGAGSWGDTTEVMGLVNNTG
ncbi:MAG: hypothetical protein Q9168_002502 [Polycauliona sp. 1 TL-2023]